ncbi:Ankyrin repeat and BTB/POZ domain-containing protein 1 [Quaeritorhiza haematococci]|nr:Ankyrin repeat and BTB/POZ domain-containing protein 1 [Quaeritorhiza haematococci]
MREQALELPYEFATFDAATTVSDGRNSRLHPLFEALCQACRTGDLNKVKYLIEVEEVPINLRDRWDSVPLYYSSLCGHFEVVKYLLQAGAHCNPNTFEGERCLYGALTDEIRNLLKAHSVSKAVDSQSDYALFTYGLFSNAAPSPSSWTAWAASSHVYPSTHMLHLLDEEHHNDADICFVLTAHDTHDKSWWSASQTSASGDAAAGVGVPNVLSSAYPHPTYFAHRCVLASRSGYFAAQLCTRWQSMRTVKVPHIRVNPLCFRGTLLWMYTGQFSRDVPLEYLDDWLFMCKQWKLDELMELVESHKEEQMEIRNLMEQFEEEDAVEAFEHAEGGGASAKGISKRNKKRRAAIELLKKKRDIVLLRDVNGVQKDLFMVFWCVVHLGDEWCQRREHSREETAEEHSNGPLTKPSVQALSALKAKISNQMSTDYDEETHPDTRRNGEEEESLPVSLSHSESELAFAFLTGTKPDICIKVGDRMFPCHRSVLKRSDYFVALLSGRFSESMYGILGEESSHSSPAPPILVVPLASISSANVMICILEFLYTDRISTLTRHAASLENVRADNAEEDEEDEGAREEWQILFSLGQDVLYAADLLLLDRLKTLTVNFIVSRPDLLDAYTRSLLRSKENGVGSEGEPPAGEEDAEEEDDATSFDAATPHSLLRAAWSLNLSRLEQHLTRYFARTLPIHLPTTAFVDLIRDSAESIAARQETDTIIFVDDLRWCLAKEWRDVVQELERDGAAAIKGLDVQVDAEGRVVRKGVPELLSHHERREELFGDIYAEDDDSLRGSGRHGDEGTEVDPATVMRRRKREYLRIVMKFEQLLAEMGIDV